MGCTPASPLCSELLLRPDRDRVTHPERLLEGTAAALRGRRRRRTGQAAVVAVEIERRGVALIPGFEFVLVRITAAIGMQVGHPAPVGQPQAVHGTVGADAKPTVKDDEVGMVSSEETTSELQSLMRISYAVLRLKKKH